MGKALVIVESPSKAKTINKYLGKDYIVKSSVGHIRDVLVGMENKQKGNKEKSEPLTREQKYARTMGIDPWNGWKIRYGTMEGKGKVIDELKFLAKNASHIYLATDLDREGESIAWHLKEVLGGDDSRYSRVVFNEITQTAIQNAFAHPQTLNMNQVNAQQTRRCLDRVVGFMASPLLWKKVARGLSAGRVQSVTTRLIVERERDIKAFIPDEFWELGADVSNSAKKRFKLSLKAVNGDKVDDAMKRKWVDKNVRESVIDALNQSTYKVDSVETKPTTSKPSAPFITSTLQQAASTRLGFGVKKTMTMAQKLYENGYITYMRTDSTNLSEDALAMARRYIHSEYGDKYLPEKPNFYASKGNAQEAHEAIRPSNVDVVPEALQDVDPDAVKLYRLIRSRFLACQMTPAIYDTTTITVNTNKQLTLTAKGRVIIFDGWTKAYPTKENDDEIQELPKVNLGEILNFHGVIADRKYTKPPARYNEASLVKELEKRGIGRPSTYASIITTIQERGYVENEQKRFTATKMGEVVTDRLMGSFPDLMDYQFTANMEDKLDHIAEGDLVWTDVLDDWFKGFESNLLQAEKPSTEGGMSDGKSKPIPEVKCPLCTRPMIVRTGVNGLFMGCSGYVVGAKDNCKGTRSLTIEKPLLKIDDDDKYLQSLRDRKRCPECNSIMESYIVKGGNRLYLCSNTPACQGHELELGNFAPEAEYSQYQCEKCQHPFTVMDGRFGKYCKCEKCGNIRGLNKDGELLPPRKPVIDLPLLPCKAKGAHFVLREGNSGIFLAAHNYPRVKETRQVKVTELVRFKDKLPEHLLYLTLAPEVDHLGTEMTVRWSRKAEQMYVSTYEQKTKTGTSYTYLNGTWVEGTPEPLPENK